jgi:hypothetical protein
MDGERALFMSRTAWIWSMRCLPAIVGISGPIALVALAAVAMIQGARGAWVEAGFSLLFMAVLVGCIVLALAVRRRIALELGALTPSALAGFGFHDSEIYAPILSLDLIALRGDGGFFLQQDQTPPRLSGGFVSEIAAASARYVPASEHGPDAYALTISLHLDAEPFHFSVEPKRFERLLEPLLRARLEPAGASVSVTGRPPARPNRLFTLLRRLKPDPAARAA